MTTSLARRSAILPRAAAIALVAAVTASCALYYRAGIGLLYRKVDIPASRVHLDVPYGPAPEHRLNLFLPAGRDWPLVVFVHGGNWDEGSKDLEVGGADIYNNIGRSLASEGIGVAVVSYRLLPAVSWQTQAADVAAAVHWAGGHAASYGGDARCVFVMGHSAGAQLAARVALDPAARGPAGEPMPAICGVIGVSGAGYDLADQRTYDLGNDPDFYEQRFGGAPGWQQDASPIRFVAAPRGAALPPFLLLYAGGESRALQRQSQLLQDTIVNAGGDSTLTIVPGESHSRIVLTLSRGDKIAGPAVVAFVRRIAQKR
ncbi:MAG: alpha/beta hydrolase [Acidobacteria bacterium]|nr:alpha/beta hydrolase [Acidobacteriota bacterium]